MFVHSVLAGQCWLTTTQEGVNVAFMYCVVSCGIVAGASSK